MTHANIRGQRIVRFTLHDADAQGDDRPMLDGKIKIGPSGIEIGFEGYGEATAAIGQGFPIYIELVGSQPRVLVWSDINQEDPTHNISLIEAMESKFKGNV